MARIKERDAAMFADVPSNSPLRPRNAEEAAEARELADKIEEAARNFARAKAIEAAAQI